MFNLIEPGLPDGVEILSLIGDAVVCTDLQGRIVYFNRAAQESFGYMPDEVLGKPVEFLLPERFRGQHAFNVQDFAAETGSARRIMGHQHEVCGRRKNGEEFPVEATVSRQTVNGKTLLTVVHRDVTQRKEFEEQQRLIARELNHRVKNLVSVVQAIVSLTAKHAGSVLELEQSLQQRLRTLLVTQDLLEGRQRQGISLRNLLEKELRQYRLAGGENLLIEGPPVSLAPEAVVMLALAFHELATNAAKHGAFSNPSGRVTVSVQERIEEDHPLIDIQWQEDGGPPVEAPRREGFGTLLLKQAVSRALRAKVTLDYRPEGLICRITAPKRYVGERR